MFTGSKQILFEKFWKLLYVQLGKNGIWFFMWKETSKLIFLLMYNLFILVQYLSILV